MKYFCTYWLPVIITQHNDDNKGADEPEQSVSKIFNSEMESIDGS